MLLKILIFLLNIKIVIMKVSLLFPPTWHPSQPYLSLPSLTGFLTQAGVKNVSQRDLGIELLDKVLTQTICRTKLYQQLVAKQRGLERERTGETGPGSAEQLARIIESLDRFPYLFERIELAKETLRGEGFYDIEAYRNSLFLIDKWLEVISSLYFPTRMTVVDNQFGDYSIYSSKDLVKAIRDETQNPYISLFREHVLPSPSDGSSGFGRRVHHRDVANYPWSHALPIDQGTSAGAACDGRRKYFYPVSG